MGPLPVSHCTFAPATKLVPVTLIRKADPPAVAEDGFNPPGEATVGCDEAAAVIGNVVSPDESPPRLSTLTNAVPGVAIRLAGTTRVRCEESTKTVGRVWGLVPEFH